MNDRTASLAAETETVRKAYAALNRNDIPAMVEAFDPAVEWIEPAEYPGGGTYRNGKVIQVRVFDETQEALEWAGVEDPDAG